MYVSLINLTMFQIFGGGFVPLLTGQVKDWTGNEGVRDGMKLPRGIAKLPIL